ncbi:hypothetical protein [Haloferax sp. DFSO60]|uniref:hypothetical protein n=1 Tax=Haloferax sp. DFSO60 TaxID=3388652 RepID=UPI00397B6717
MEGFGHTESRSRRVQSFPAYGPIDAAISYTVFYIFVEYATQTIVEAVTTVFPTVSPSSVRFGLAVFLWFILAVTLLDQIRRQLSALGGDATDDSRWYNRPSGVPSGSWMVVYGVLTVVGGAIAYLTFDSALETGRVMIQLVATLDVSSFVPLDFIVLVVFFVSFGVATRSLDRLVIGGIRAIAATNRTV